MEHAALMFLTFLVTSMFRNSFGMFKKFWIIEIFFLLNFDLATFYACKNPKLVTMKICMGMHISYHTYFLTHFAGISDVAEAYLAATKAASVESNEVSPTSIEEKANAISEHLRVDQTTAVGKIQDGLQYLSYVVVSTSMPAA